MFGTFIALVVLLGFTYLVGSAIHSVTLHPLADVPGPKLCAISRIPYWRVNMNGTDIHWMKKLHDEYGPVVRFGPTDLSYATAQAWQDIHGLKVTEKAPEFSVQPINGTYQTHSLRVISRFDEMSNPAVQVCRACSQPSTRSTPECGVYSPRPSPNAA